MHNPSHFEETRIEVLRDLIRRHPLGILVTLTAGGLDANHIPFELDPDLAPYGTLRGHVARANPVWRDFSRDVQALAVFRGVDSYITPSWYQTKKESGKVVPTWNYAVVHAHGPLRVVDDKEWLRKFVTKLTARHEAPRADPWRIADAPADYIEKMLTAIVGIEIPVARLEGKWKVSQNRTASDRQGVVEGLEAETGDAAAAMAQMVREALRGN
ncbi:MAG: FMN-binding negative transcriptional regulator [Betaproteobacteria bacterium]|nr:FMN-binding negative transcriptional regulator [Betaproteobacteria bacterium]